MAKKRKLSKKKIINFIIVLLIIVIAIVGIYFLLNKDNKKAISIKEVDSIKAYGYTLNDHETKYYKDLFSDLKKELEKETVDYDNYAKLLSQLFITDFYNLDNKINSSDVGGTQFVYKKFQNDFEKFAKDTKTGIYAYIENNIYGDRKQELPIVTKVEITNSKTESFTYNSNTDSKAYKIDVKITYKKDLGYPTECSLVLIHSDKKLEVAKLK